MCRLLLLLSVALGTARGLTCSKSDEIFAPNKLSGIQKNQVILSLASNGKGKRSESYWEAAFDTTNWQDFARRIGTQDFSMRKLLADGAAYHWFDYGLGDNDFGTVCAANKVVPIVRVNDGDWLPLDKKDAGLSACLEKAAGWPPLAAAATHGNALDWTVNVATPHGANITKVSRGGDKGWGVDVTITEGNVKALVWDTDGDAFFLIAMHGAYCKVDVGSDGQEPGPRVYVFEEMGMRCEFVHANGGPRVYQVTAKVELVSDGSADCKWNQRSCPEGWRANPGIQSGAVLHV